MASCSLSADQDPASPARRPNCTRNRGARRHDIGLLEIGQHAPAGYGVALAGFAQLDRAGRAMEKLHADMPFKKGHGAAHRGG
jgi:hypothetical protein